MKAKKENKVYTINTEQEKQRYLKEGFDIYDNEGNLLEHSPLKKIAYGKYAEIEKENQELKAANEELKAKITDLEAQLKAEADALVEEATNAEGTKKTTKKA